MRPPPPGPRALAAARRALDDAQWARARDLLREQVEVEGAPAWELLAEAAWWLDDGSACLAARETAYRLHRESGDVRGAAAAATALGYDAALFGQGASVASGWLARARRLLAEVDGPLPEHGWLAVREAELALQVTHRPDTAHEAATEAVAVARSLGRTDIEHVGLGLLGLVEVTRGRVDEGMELLDAAVAGALSGEVGDVMWVGKVCCWLVGACREAQDLARAVEWCERVDALCRERDLAPLFTACRIQYASVRLAGGHWLDAEVELVAALERMRDSRRATRTDAVVQLGHLRRRQGRLPEAEALYVQAGYAPAALVGRALVRLARGETAPAWALVADLLEDVAPTDLMTRAAVLLPVVRCAVAAGRPEEAERGAAELAELSAQLGTEAAHGAAAVARALVAASGGASGPAGADAARSAWRAAARSFHAAALPVEAAEAHLALARLLAADEPGSAADEVRWAVTTLEAVEAPELLAQARGMLGGGGPAVDGSARPTPSPVLTPREVEVLRLVATGASNARIARELVVSEHTVHRHVANILTRLGEPTRGAAALRAVRDGLI
ncbi:helix-turn-helix domain-containing protein [Phycicoccus duodecadis]|uniref:DNA-binding NarL/FixJ family response regulator n=1 Tax=Phycicoccus duodecadis TaxID=173053 RepID=A0A2N3YMX6_9MICO|nr:helix-turn-helix transcriptional regulator [Phycicoccus duodecadis]PKW28159.1 DNA-binding NarL/FixJ family response regulator [Phycicoccus duodecadis]